MAARHGDALGVAQALALALVQLGQAVDPVVIRTERGAGVDDAGVRVVDQRDGLARGNVRQAQECDIGGIQEFGALGRILALVFGDAQELDIVALRQIVEQAKAGGAFLTVDENLECHGDLAKKTGAEKNAGTRRHVSFAL